MEKRLQHDLSKRERQIIEIVYRNRKATVREVLSEIPNPPSYSAVRTLLNILVEKRLLKRAKVGKRFHYSPTISQKKAMRTAFNNLLNTYFDNSLEQAVTALLELNSRDLNDADLDRLTQIIDEARKKGHTEQ